MIKILVVANPAEGVDLLVARLRQAGYATTHAESGEAALDRLAAAIPDLVVLDWQLSRMSGAAVCRILRADERLLGMPILVLGAGERPHERRTAEALGADDYLVYPCDLDELLQHVRVQVRGATHDRYCPLTALPVGRAVVAAIRQ